MVDFRKQAPEVGFTAASSVSPPTTQNLDLGLLAEPAIQIVDNINLEGIQNQFTKFNENLPGVLDTSDQQELDSIQGNLDRELARLKQKRLRPLQRKTAIQSKANELIQENPRYATQISRMAQGLSPTAAKGEKTQLEKMLDEAQAQAAAEGVSTEIVFKRMGLVQRAKDMKILNEASKETRGVTQDQLFDEVRHNQELMQQNLMLTLNRQAETGAIDSVAFSSQVDQTIEGQINEWRARSFELTGRYPSSQAVQQHRQELQQGFQWIKDLAGSKDALELSKKAKAYASNNHWLNMNETYPDITAMVSVFGPQKGFEAADLLARATTPAQREAIKATNPLAAVLSSREFNNTTFNAGSRVYGYPKLQINRRSTPAEHKSVEDTMAASLRKQEIEGQTDKSVREAVFNSFLSEDSPVQMLSMYGSKEAYVNSFTNEKEVKWFKDEWSRQTKANIDILRNAAKANVSFSVEDGKIKGKIVDIRKQKVGSAAGGFGLGGALTPDPEITRAIDNLNRLGGYLQNGWFTVFTDTGLTRDNVIQSFVDTANLDPSVVDSLLQIQNLPESQESSELLQEVEALLQENPDASAADLREFLQSKRDVRNADQP